jgi:AcrR family transcriptional regulator
MQPAASTPERARRTQAQRSEAMRRRVLDAAVQVLGERGYAGFRTAEVADAAGASRGALTHHFPTKDALVLAALEHVFRTATERARQRAHRVRSPADAIRALIEDSRDFFFSDLFLIALDLAILGGRDSPNNAQILEMSRANRLPVEAAWLDALIEVGVPAKVAEDLLWLTTSIVRGLAVRRVLADDPARFERLLRRWRAMVEGYLEQLGRESTPRASSSR